MNTELDLERLLRAHLAERADSHPAEGALEAILAVTTQLRPRGSRRIAFLDSIAPGRNVQPVRLTGRVVVVLVLLGMLLALAIGATLIGSSGSRPVVVVEPSPPAPSLATTNHHNGPITLAFSGVVMAIDPGTAAQSTTIATGPAEYVDWAPDGRRLAIVNGAHLSTLDTTTGSIKAINPSLTIRSQIAWSPDGTLIAYEDLDGVHVIDLASGRETHLAAYPGSLDGAGSPQVPLLQDRPSWTPDGRAVRYTSLGQTYLAYADGSRAQVLGPVPADFEWGLAWSPDGTKVAYFDDPLQAPAPTGGDPYVLQLWVANADGSRPTNVFERPGCCIGIIPTGPIWSPDGTKIAIGLGSFGLMVVDPVTRVHRNIDTNPAGDLGWRPVP